MGQLIRVRTWLIDRLHQLMLDRSEIFSEYVELKVKLTKLIQRRTDVDKQIAEVKKELEKLDDHT